eukprot:TRINITY_DN12587_c0_g1_i8.p1 TRINITY_DN12587_c0_g1~~TRINITY_DN12587_c0_g1_i8.p1  ORF type:complete len:235 (+),score=64.03 TRINITY_DN12587_c0_g1_i8:188-892(+)
MAGIQQRLLLLALCLMATCTGLEFPQAFSAGDANADGKLSKKELRVSMDALGVRMNKNDALFSSSIFDVNSDNRIDLGEFEELAAFEASGAGSIGRLCRRILEAAGATGLVEGAAYYLDRIGLAVSPAGYGFYTCATLVLLPLYLLGVFFGWKHEWFIKLRAYLSAACVGGLLALILFAQFDLPNDIPGYVVMFGFVLGNLFALEYLFDDGTGKKKRTKGKGRQVAKMMAGKRK